MFKEYTNNMIRDDLQKVKAMVPKENDFAWLPFSKRIKRRKVKLTRVNHFDWCPMRRGSPRILHTLEIERDLSQSLCLMPIIQEDQVIVQKEWNEIKIN